MATKRTSTILQSPKLAREELVAGVRKIGRRLDELKAFNTFLAEDELQSQADAMEARINSSIGEIFGEGSAVV